MQAVRKSVLKFRINIGLKMKPSRAPRGFSVPPLQMAYLPSIQRKLRENKGLPVETPSTSLPKSLKYIAILINDRRFNV